MKKPPVSSEENKILNELIELAEGVGRTKEIAILNRQQARVAEDLMKKGYIM